MHPRDFNSRFEMSSSIVVVPRHDGRLIKETGQDWPAELFGREGGGQLASLLRRAVSSVWQSADEGQGKRVVGTVDDFEVERTVTIFERV